MKLSEACMEIEEWVGYTAYDFCIGNVELKANGAYKFDVYEKTPCDDDQYFLTVEPDGRIINCNGDDCIEVSRNAYDDYPEILKFIDRFEAKWYRKDEFNDSDV